MRLAVCAIAVGLLISLGHAQSQVSLPDQHVARLALIPAGSFEMGDHHGFVDPKHGGDETPIHTVRLDAFYMGICDITTQQYCDFLGSALAERMIEVRQGGVYLAGGNDLLCETREMSPYSRIGWDGVKFSVLDNKGDHPIVCIRWPGAAVYCNWLSGQEKKPLCYNTSTWDCDFNKSGYRLPTEAEWEYAARGGLNKPYRNFPWGDEADATKANWPESKNPFRAGPLPWTTPVGFFDGKIHRKADFRWPGNQETYQSANGVNGYGLYDMAGNVWQFVNDWYERSYYAYSPAENPPGPQRGNIMPDGKPYRGMRGGNWYNGENGHSRVSNRDPSYWRGPQDPNHPYYHVGFRIVLPIEAEKRPAIKPTEVPEQLGKERGSGGPRPARDSVRESASPRLADRTGQGGGLHLMPREVEETLNLTDQQREQIADLEQDVQARLVKILTPQQQKQLENARPPRRPGGPDQGTSGQSVDRGGPQAQQRDYMSDAQPHPGRPEPATSGRRESSPLTDDRKQSGSFVLRSPEVADGGQLPKDYTADGSSATLPLEWNGAPEGTRSYALIMHHVAPDGIKWYWTLYNIPATVHSLPRNVKGVGTLGNNSINERTEYAPPKSKGPGPKTYIYTVYALSSPVQLSVSPTQVSREVLLAAMKDRTLASAELRVVYSRPGGGDMPSGERGAEPADRRPPRPDQDDPGADDDRRSPQRGDRPREDAPPRPDNRDGGQRAERAGGPGGEQRPGGAGGREAMAENRTPTSPTPGQTVGLFLNASGAFNGYTLFAPKHNNVIYLIDNQGHIVHQWKSAYEPGQSVYLKPNGNLLHCCFTKNRGFTSGGEGGRVEEFDWDGKLVWEFEYSSDQHLSHHDIAPMSNGNILMLVVEKKSVDECVAAGFDPRMLRDRQLFPDSIIEVQPTYPKGGKIVWEWHVWDHLVQDLDKSKANYGDVAAHPELVYVNCNGRATPAFWNHMNSIAYNAKLDQIALSVRGCNEIWLLDHSTTMKEATGHTGGKHGKGGDLIYRWGNPAAYKRGTERDKQLVQQHDAEWIPDGYPGAGHITIFNNGYDRGYSSIEEIVPPVDAGGRYVIESDKPYGPDKPVWHYEAKKRGDFFSSEISGAHRLPNGNTLICAGVIGHLFEITPTGEMVWQYVNPMVRGGILAQGELPGKDVRGHLFNAVFKVHRYAPDYPGLAGRDLTPKGVIELPVSQKGKTGMDQANASPDERPGGPRGQAGPGGNRDGSHPGDRPPPRDRHTPEDRRRMNDDRRPDAERDAPRNADRPSGQQ